MSFRPILTPLHSSVMIFLFFLTFLYGEEISLQKLNLKTEKIIVFKDGYSLILKRGTAITNEKGEVYTDDVPDSAVLGSFWATAKNHQIISMQAGWKEKKIRKEEEIRCTQYIEILQANKGKSCSVQMKDKTSYQGVLLEILSQTRETPLLQNHFNSEIASFSGQFSSQLSKKTPWMVSELSGSSFVLRLTEGDILLPIAQIKTLLISDMKTTLKRIFMKTEQKKRITFHFAEKSKACEILLMYFRPGVRWIPTYQINLPAASNSSDKKDESFSQQLASIKLQAEIINDAEPLNGVLFDLVVGVPHFRFRGSPSPFILERTLKKTLRQSTPQLMNQFRNDFSNGLYATNNVEQLEVAAKRDGVGQEVELPNELTGMGKQDLFVYHLPKLTLDKGERAAVLIFKTKAPFRDIYTWNLHFQHQRPDVYEKSGDNNSPLKLSKNDVWHQLQLDNLTKFPWTTGAAMIMQGQQPLAQELLTYTASNGRVRIPITVSVETRGKLFVKEISRELNALKWKKYNYLRIDEEASLQLFNLKSFPIEVEIHFRFGGKFTEISHQGEGFLRAFRSEDWYQYYGERKVNQSSQVTWRSTVLPGKVFTPKVKYSYFLRH